MAAPAEAPPNAAEPGPSPVVFPADGVVTAAWCAALAATLAAASLAPAAELPRLLPAKELSALIAAATRAVKDDEALVALAPGAGGRITVVGDTHGQYHDVLRLLELAGCPSADNLFILNGDFVDRGAWGVEVIALFMAWKLALPGCVAMLRGNHEGEYCAQNYGFQNELLAKYGPKSGKALFASFLKLFTALPLGAHVGRTFVCHGGLFRKPPAPTTKKRGRAKADDATAGGEDDDATAERLELSRLGSLADLRADLRKYVDPGDEDPTHASRLASDVVWSDPAAQDGLRVNTLRGCGLVFGPDATEAFLVANGLTLIIRSHEGPDARMKRDDRDAVGDMMDGWSVDHTTASGRLATLFSAPDYPQFCAEGEPRPGNRAAFCVLRAPHYDEPEVTRFNAAPRPQGQLYYKLDTPGSDAEGPGGGATSGDDDDE